MASIKTRDIHERIYNFVIRVINLTKELPNNQHNLIIIEQIIRSVTSVGANDQEADAAQSKKDFLQKYGIVKKELKETNYWLRIIADINPKIRKRMQMLIGEGKQLLLIKSSIIINTKEKL